MEGGGERREEGREGRGGRWHKLSQAEQDRGGSTLGRLTWVSLMKLPHYLWDYLHKELLFVHQLEKESAREREDRHGCDVVHCDAVLLHRNYCK